MPKTKKMTSASKFLDINDNNEGNPQKGKIDKIPVPGGKLKRVFKTARIELAIISAYKLGYKLFKDIILPRPQIEMNRKHSGQVCVLTGGGRGIGFEILKILLQLDYTVILGVRNLTVVESEIKTMRKNCGIFSGQVKILHLDLKSLRSVRNFADEVLSSPEGARIDMLINHAGIFQDRYEVTEDNIECHFQVNYLSHFLLTNLLLPRIKETAATKLGHSSCHIINTSSRLQCVGSLRFDNLAEKKMYVPVECYCDTKLCLILHAKTTQCQLDKEGVKNVHMYASHPGEIPTALWHDVGIIETALRPLAKAVCQTTTDAANTILYPALTPNLSDNCGGKYFELHKVAKPNPQAEDEQVREQLWKMSLKLTT